MSLKRRESKFMILAKLAHTVRLTVGLIIVLIRVLAMLLPKEKENLQWWKMQLLITKMKIKMGWKRKMSKLKMQVYNILQNQSLRVFLMIYSLLLINNLTHQLLKLNLYQILKINNKQKSGRLIQFCNLRMSILAASLSITRA